MTALDRSGIIFFYKQQRDVKVLFTWTPSNNMTFARPLKFWRQRGLFGEDCTLTFFLYIFTGRLHLSEYTENFKRSNANVQRWVTMNWNVLECQETVLTNLCMYLRIRLLPPADRYSADQFWCLWQIFRWTTVGVIFAHCSWRFLSLFQPCFCGKGRKPPQILEHRQCCSRVLCHMEQNCSSGGGGVTFANFG